MLKLIAVFVLLAGFAATAPVIAIPSAPPLAGNQDAAEKQRGTGSQMATNLVPGISNKAPLYVKAECENGCGYAKQESWGERIKNDPGTQFAGAVAFFTLLTLLVLNGQRKAAHAANEHHRISERSYVQMSHVGGLEFLGFGIPHLRMQIRNWGRTPARVIRSAQQFDIRLAEVPLPAVPEYVFNNDSQSGFLVTDATMNWSQAFLDNPITPEHARSGHLAVRIIGCVEYEDRFGGRHQARYARRYRYGIELAAAIQGNLTPDTNNLVFDTAAGYNDDVPIPNA